MAKPTGLHRIAPWRFLVFGGVFLSGWAFAAKSPYGREWFDSYQAVLAAFDVAALVFLATCVPLFRHGPAEMRSLAERSDANRGVVIVLCAVVTAVIFAALVGEIGLVGTLCMRAKLLVLGSLLLTWTFAQAVCALHYAHLYYGRGKQGEDRAGLEFPRTPEPVISDFAYFAFTLGVAVQTSDVQITSRHIRNFVTLHSVTGFFYNLVALALAVSVLGSR